MSSTLYVDLSKIGKNLEAVNSRIGARIKRMAVIKDEAYGHGLIPVANYLQDKVEWLCVARLEEAMRLRDNGVRIPILVFEIPPSGKEHLYKKHEITASISDLSVFERLEEGTDCHLHFDTGMFRLGILPEDTSEALSRMKKYNLNYSGIFTHYANSDVPDHPAVIKQIEVFNSIRSQFPHELMAHTCNSGGIFYYNGKDALFDAVRPGICLYGYEPGDMEESDLAPVIEWKSQLVQVKKIKKGNAVGYGSIWQAPEDGWLGIIPVGYSDGIFRNLSNNFLIEISGEAFPQVGRVSMNYIAVYLGQKQLQPGTALTLLRDGKLSAKEWARKIGTIPYEITTTISPKVVREYI